MSSNIMYFFWSHDLPKWDTNNCICGMDGHATLLNSLKMKILKNSRTICSPKAILCLKGLLSLWRMCTPCSKVHAHCLQYGNHVKVNNMVVYKK